MDENTDLSRSDMVQVRRAIRQDWALSDDVKTKLLKRLVAYCDPENGDQKPRVVIAAARTIASLMKLSLGQQAIDLARERYEGKATEIPLDELITEAERRALQRALQRERARGPESSERGDDG